MFSKVHKLMGERNLDEAVEELLILHKDTDSKVAAYAGYLLGYINTRFDYKARSAAKARHYLRENISGTYPHPYAYVLYSQLEEDHNIALNHLNKGLEKFPTDARILEELLEKSPEKGKIITLIKDSGLTNPLLMGSAIRHLIREGKWNSISRFVFRIESVGNLEEDELLYLDLICAYSYLFQDNPEYGKAQELLEKTITKDTDNRLAYSHYLGLIYSFIKQGDALQATRYFDRLPLNNSIGDLNDGPMPFGIYIDFEEIYKIIFNSILEMFDCDDSRKLIARVLYVLYLYHPSEIYDIYRYKKSDAAILTRYLKVKFNPRVAAALYNMRCHFKQFKEAYVVLWSFLEEGEKLTDSSVFFSSIIEFVNRDQLELLAEQTIMFLKEDNYYENIFVYEVLGELVEILHKHHLYSSVRRIADFFADGTLVEAGCAFECAYAFGEDGNNRATTLYEQLVKKSPNDSAVINNLGVQYRNKGELYRALRCYEKANQIDPQKELYKNNLDATKKVIQQQIEEEIKAAAKGISMASLRKIGYTIDLCKKAFQIQDTDLSEIIQRDLRECAIAVVAGQDKLATIMCGSIIEALLLYRVREAGIAIYDISEISHRKDSKTRPTEDMVLNELLYVANKEKILDKADHQLGHYLKDYRNMVHPAREIRSKENVTHENVATMWAVLVRLISALFPE